MTRFQIGVRNEAVALRRVPWLAEQAGAIGIALDAIPVDATDAQGEIAALLSARGLDGLWLEARHLPPGTEPDRACAACVARMNPRAALVDRESYRFDRLPEGRRIAASEDLIMRQVRETRPDIEWVDLGGDVSTQLHKVHLENADGLIAAASDLLTLGLSERAFDYISTEAAIPPAGQGTWVLCAAEGSPAWTAFAPLDDAESRRNLAAELEFVTALGADEKTLVGARARVQRGKLHIEAAACPDGGDVVRMATAGSLDGVGAVVGELLDGFRGR